MSENTKLNPATTVREAASKVKVSFDRNGEISQTHLLDWIMAMTALFSPATEKAAKVCGHDGRGQEWPCVLPEMHSGPCHQPEPAAPEMPPMPNAVHNLVLWCQMLSASQYGQGFRSQIKADLDAFTDWWRTNSQPVAHPFKAGFKPDSMRHFAEYVRDNWHYFGTDTAGLAHQFLQEMAAQPVAVGMAEELSMVLLRAEYGATEDERNPNLRDGYVARLKDAIAAVRQQTAQGKPKVELPKVPVFEIRWASQFLRTGTNHRTPLKSGYADAIDAWLAELDAAEGRK